MAGKGGRVWLGSLQLTPILVTCHTPWIVGVVSRGALSALHTSEVLAARPRAIATICVLSFIFCFLCLIWFWLLWPSLIPHREELFLAVHQSTERKSARGYAEVAPRRKSWRAWPRPQRGRGIGYPLKRERV